MVVKGNLISFAVLNKKTKAGLGWDLSPLTSHTIHCKKLRDEGLHPLLGVVEYCMKDNGEEHFEFVHHNVLVSDMNHGIMEYKKFGKVGLNNRVSLLHSNFLQRAHQ